MIVHVNDHSTKPEPPEDKDYSQHPEAVRARAAKARGRDHNNMRKRQRGECAECHLPVVAGEECMFDWDHVDTENKHMQVSALLAYATSTMDEEIAKCRLLCHN